MEKYLQQVQIFRESKSFSDLSPEESSSSKESDTHGGEGSGVISTSCGFGKTVVIGSLGSDELDLGHTSLLLLSSNLELLTEGSKVVTNEVLNEFGSAVIAVLITLFTVLLIDEFLDVAEEDTSGLTVGVSPSGDFDGTKALGERTRELSSGFFLGGGGFLLGSGGFLLGGDDGPIVLKEPTGALLNSLLLGNSGFLLGGSGFLLVGGGFFIY